jgi:trehalose 6-phosphate phosphatase
MKSILARANRDVLARFAEANVLVGLDYDGTLAPIVADPKRATMRPRTRELLARVAELYPCVVISGRARSDTRARLDGVAVRGVIGNHGAELRRGAKGGPQVRRWLPRLSARLCGVQGVVLEDKRHSLAIHYRAARQKRKARDAVLEAAASLGPVRIVGGKQVVNVLPRGAPHKGDALERERRRLGCDAAIYVGDDVTDEDVFGHDRPERLLAIRVGAKRGSAAPWCVRDQRQVDALLGELARLRSS